MNGLRNSPRKNDYLHILLIVIKAYFHNKVRAYIVNKSIKSLFDHKVKVMFDNSKNDFYKI